MKRNKKPTNTIEGVAQRQRRRSLGDFSDTQKISGDSFNSSSNNTINQATAAPGENTEEIEIITEKDIIENTRSDVDKSKLGGGSWRSRRKAKKLIKKQKLSRRHVIYRVFRRTVKFAIVAVILVGGYLGITSLSAINSIIDRNGDGALALQDNISPSQLKSEGDGRINILLIGIGGDGHVAGDLADSIIVASIDPFTHEMAMLSVPRDLYVEVPGYYSTRINAAHSIGEEQAHEGGGIALLQETIEEVLAIDIHYYVRVDFQGFVEAVDIVGGVTINLDEPVYDPNFDWEFGYNALNLPAGEVTLDGSTALLLARARGASGIGLGVARGDFGRGDQQRKILLGLKDKIFSIGTFANPVKLTSLLRSAGSHLRTNLQPGEMLALYDILEEVPADKIVSFGLDNGADNYLSSTNIAGAAVLVPKTGNFNDIQLFVRGLFVDGFIRSEAPLTDVYNGTLVAGLAGSTADDLRSYGYKIGVVDNAQEQTYATSVGYDLSDGDKEYTKALLSNRFGMSMKPASQLPAEFAGTEADFVIIIGDNYVQQETNF